MTQAATLAQLASSGAITADTSGNVGIGNPLTDQYAKITSYSSATQVSFSAYSAGTAGYPAFGFAGQITPNGGRGAGMYLITDGVLGWSTNGAERMRIESSGNLYVGTTTSLGSDDGRLSVRCGSTITPIRAYRQTTVTGAALQIWQSDVGGTNVEKYFVLANGTATASDARLKENIDYAPNYLNKICEIKVRNYTWVNQESDEKDLGVIAQEVEEVLPEVIWENPNADETQTSYKAVRYDKFVPMLIKSIQELKAELDVCKAEIAALKGV
jgi:hypothetical protein